MSGSEIKECPGGCGTKEEHLYVGFNMVECPEPSCSHYSEKQEKIVEEVILEAVERAYKEAELENSKNDDFDLPLPPSMSFDPPDLNADDDDDDDDPFAPYLPYVWGGGGYP